MKLTNKLLTDSNLTSLLEINARINAKSKTTNISKKTHYKKKEITTSIRSQRSRSFARFAKLCLQKKNLQNLKQATKDKV